MTSTRTFKNTFKNLSIMENNLTNLSKRTENISNLSKKDRDQLLTEISLQTKLSKHLSETVNAKCRAIEDTRLIS